ncbi:hypothetical protein FHC09_22440 [Enterobacter roggenkampii]|nr:hypothetical protein [Enterobacter roggenkampii]
MAHDVPLGCAPDEYDDLISGTCSHLPKDWVSLESVIIDGNSLPSVDVTIESVGNKIDSGFSSKLKYLEYKVQGKI